MGGAITMGLGIGGYKLHKNGTKNTGDSTLMVVGEGPSQ